jgi:hypothetical protein
MLVRASIGILVLAAVLGLAFAAAQPIEPGKHPDWKGKWIRTSAGTFDPDKPPGLGQRAPLTDEYQKILEASLADQARGGQGNNPMAACIPPGMPRMMIGYGGGMEIVVTPDITYMVMGEPMLQLRRIYTDGRNWPENLEPSFSGTSIGKWEGPDQDGRYQALAVETRGMKSPRSYDSSGMPFHRDNQAVVKERIYLDRADANMLRDEITVTDHALMRPWTVMRTYRRDRNPSWMETICGEDEHQVKIGKEQYFLSGDGMLMPTRKDQAAPDLRFFNQSQK